MSNLDQLNKQVHELTYTSDTKTSTAKLTKVDRKRGRELAEKIKQNIEQYQHDSSSRSEPHYQA